MSAKKLQLTTEVVRTLVAGELAHVVGGGDVGKLADSVFCRRIGTCVPGCARPTDACPSEARTACCGRD